jgi:hypothetical protein
MAARGRKFSKQETTRLLDFVDRDLPCDDNDWTLLASKMRDANLASAPIRSMEAIRSKVNSPSDDLGLMAD